MSWKNLAFRKKLFISFGSLVVLIILIAFVAIKGVSHVNDNRQSEKLYKDVAQRITDHYIWVNKVYSDILDEDKTHLDVQTDDHLCNLGKWLYNNERKDLEAMMPELSDSLKSLENPHFVLHESAKKINLLMKNKNNDNHHDLITQANEILQSESVPALKQIQSTMNEILSRLQDRNDRISQVMSQTASFTRTFMFILSILGIFLSVTISLFMSSYILKEIRILKEFSEKMSTGDLTAEMSINQDDEFGHLATSLKQTSRKLGEMFSSIVSEIIGLSSSSNALFSVSNQLAEGSGDMSENSFAVAAAAEEMSSNMNSVAAASEESSTSITMVAAAAEEMTSSIQTIAVSLDKARAITLDAVSKSRDASEKVNELGGAATDISKVTEAITEISEQTNLLALNATIEAARAGEAGKGFAVVANEIKELARQTAQATQDIKDKVKGIQDGTASTSTEINEISQVIHDVNDIVSSISLSLEEQAKATSEIADNVSQASVGIQEVNLNVSQCSLVASEIARDISNVSKIANDIKTGSINVNDNAGDLSSFASKVRGMVEAFKIPENTNQAQAFARDGQSVPDLIVFNDSIKLGLRDIDKQHEKLVNLINQLHRNMKLRLGKDKAADILNELVDYTVTHFAFEEKLFKEHKYEDLTSHTIKHKELVAKVNDFNTKFTQGNAMLTMDLMDFLKDWLVNHIKGTDKKYAPFLKSKGVS